MRAYRALLHLYPASFRAEYGEEMRAIFARHKGDAAGAAAVAALWVATFFEVLLNAAALHGDILRQDLRYTVRSLGRCPGFALTAILVTALGVGANTAAFSVTDFVLIRPVAIRPTGYPREAVGTPCRATRAWSFHRRTMSTGSAWARLLKPWALFTTDR